VDGRRRLADRGRPHQGHQRPVCLVAR
jgi:hypothetical protein